MLEVGKTYTTKEGRQIEIVSHDPNWADGMFWGNSIDNLEPKLVNERWQPDGKWLSYLSQFSMLGARVIRNEKLDLIFGR